MRGVGQAKCGIRWELQAMGAAQTVEEFIQRRNIRPCFCRAEGEKNAVKWDGNKSGWALLINVLSAKFKMRVYCKSNWSRCRVSDFWFRGRKNSTLI